MQRWACLAARTTARRRHSTALDVQPASRPAAPAPPDPHTLLRPELTHLRLTLLHLLGSSHPALTQIAEYYFRQPAKQLRPLLVLLFARATNGLGAAWPQKRSHADADAAPARADELDRPLTRPDVLNDWNPNMPDHTASFDTAFALRPPPPVPRPRRPPCPLPRAPSVPSVAGQILPTQTRLAQIVEMIHVATLLHDDVLDASPLRRGVLSAPEQFGNKMAVLAGDFLLGRASAALSRLGEPEVVELIATVITNLVEGEFLQAKGVHDDDRPPPPQQDPPQRVSREQWSLYLQKCYLKSASLLAKGARAAVILGGARDGEIWKEIAYAYGRNIGIAFQLVDDILDYVECEDTLGKPGGADLKLGLATAPALYAWEEHPDMGPLIQRRFKEHGDVEMARELVRRSKGVERTRDLARSHAAKAREVLEGLPDSDAKLALEALTESVVRRKH